MLDRLAGNTALKSELGAALRAGRLPHAILVEILTDEGAGTMFVKEKAK